MKKNKNIKIKLPLKKELQQTKKEKNTEIEHKCKNCLLYNQKENNCKVAILINGEEFHMPVSPQDNCHMEELGIEVNEVKWWAVDPQTGQKSEDGKGIIKIEYPENFFGNDNVNNII